MIDNYEARKLNEAIKNLQSGSGDSHVSMPAQVLGTDEEGTTWVQIVGGNEKTPLANSSVALKEGDMVDVSIGKGRAAALGNWTDPSASSSKVTEIDGIARSASQEAAFATQASEAAQTAAEEAAAVANATNQHFWHRSEAGDAGAGAFVTDMTQDEFLAGESDGFSDWDVSDPESESYKPYFNGLWNSLGMLFRTALNNIVSLGHSAVAFFDGLGNDPENIVALFGRDGSRIGKASTAHVNITSTGLAISSGTLKQAEFLVDQEVSAWVSPGTDSCVVLGGGIATLTGGDSGYLVLPSSKSIGGTLFVNKNSPIVATTILEAQSNFRFYRSITSESISESQLYVSYHGDKLTTADGITTISPNQSWSLPIIKTKGSGDPYGHAILLGGGGLTIVGAGEAADNLYTALGLNVGDETLHLGADGNTYIYSNCQTVANRKRWVFGTDGHTTLPNPLRIGQGGTGLTASPSMLVNLASTTAANILTASPRPGVTGTLPIAHGGTGIDAFGTITNVSGSATSVASKTAKSIASWKCTTAGVYLIIVGFRFKKNNLSADTTSVREGCFGSTKDTMNNNMLESVKLPSNWGVDYTKFEVVTTASLTKDTTYYATVYHNSTTDVESTAYMRFVRIG